MLPAILLSHGSLMLPLVECPATDFLSGFRFPDRLRRHVRAAQSHSGHLGSLGNGGSHSQRSTSERHYPRLPRITRHLYAFSYHRLLLARGHRIEPYTIRLIDRTVEECVLQPIALEVVPGSRTTGIAVLRLEETEAAQPTAHTLWLAELSHRDKPIRDALAQRRSFRGARRSRKTRCRQDRFLNRRKPDTWLPPSLTHRVDTALTWVSRLHRLAPISQIDIEIVRFDTQILQNPEISSIGYQQGDLVGFEVREAVLERDNRSCIYCDETTIPFEVDHVIPRSKGGSNQFANLVCSCVGCNRRKSNRSIEEFLADDPARLDPIRKRLKAPLKDAAAVNATRKAIVRTLASVGTPIRVWSGGRTKWNPASLNIPTDHSLDAACVGGINSLEGWNGRPVICIKSTGRKRTLLDKHGGIRGYLAPGRHVNGLRTGDYVIAPVANGEKAGIHRGRVAVRRTGSFNIQTGSETIQAISWKHCRLIQRADGYSYSRRPGTQSSNNQ
jgi:hypothetical protein